MPNNPEAIIRAARASGWNVREERLERRGVSNDEPDVRYVFERGAERWSLVAQGAFGQLRHVRGLARTGTASSPADLRAVAYILDVWSRDLTTAPRFPGEPDVAQRILSVLREAGGAVPTGDLQRQVGEDAEQVVDWLIHEHGLRQRGGIVELAGLVAQSPSELARDWDLSPGDQIRRVDLHDRYGGGRQGGIAPSRKTPNVLIFSDAASGHQHGYFDRWEGDTFVYCGEGQAGDQEMTHGNRAILDHGEHQRALRVFQGARGTVTYIGEFELDPEAPWSPEPAPSTTGDQRLVIMFRLRPVSAQVPEPNSGEVGEEYREEDEEVATRARDEFRVDPDAVDRALRGHRHTQNLLARWARNRGYRPRRPGKGEPRFDVAWQQGDVLVVAEVKSLSGGLAQTGQLRLGLGQVLDYAAQFEDRGLRTKPVLAVEHEPDERWDRVCSRNGVVLIWPEVFSRLSDVANKR